MEIIHVLPNVAMGANKVVILVALEVAKKDAHKHVQDLVQISVLEA